MPVEIPASAIAAGEHVVHFYEHDEQLVATVGPYLAAAIGAGETAIVIATETHRRAMASALVADGVDLSRAAGEGRFIAIDAAATLATFTADGELERDGFDLVIGGLLRQAAESGRTVRAYGEMVSLLWEEGNVLAAIELETLWNDLGRELPFTLFCSYPAMSATGHTHAEALHHVCHLHSSVLTPAPGASVAAPAEEPADSSTERSLSASFAPEPNAPAQARHLVAHMLRRWGYEDRFVNEVILVVSELTCNAVRHAGSQFSVSVGVLEDSTLRVAVEDHAPLAASAPNGGLTPQPLHGLDVIDKLCGGDWGVQRTREGKIVWAQLSCGARLGEVLADAHL